MVNYPKQKVTKAQKDFDWYKDCANFHIETANFGGSLHTEFATLERARDGEINPSDYTYILNPFGNLPEKIKNFPSRMRSYNIIEPIVKIRLGELLKRKNDYTLIAFNEDIENDYKQSLNMKMEEILTQRLINGINAGGIKTGVESKEVPEPEEVVEKHKETFDDTAAIEGQHVMEYLEQDLRMEELIQNLASDYLTYGRCFTYKEVIFDDVNWYHIPVEEVYCKKSKNSSLVEDGSVFVWRRRMNINDVIDRYREVLKDTDIDWLEDLARKYTNLPNINSYQFVSSENLDGIYGHFADVDAAEMYVYIVQWKTFVKRGIVMYIDEFGQIQEKEVEDDYKFNPETGDISVDWGWYNEVCEVHKIGADNSGASEKGLFLYGQPALVQRTELNNTSKCKLSFNGIISQTGKGKVRSNVKTGAPYQALYNIYQYQRELLINKNKDKIAAIPIGLFPKDYGEDPYSAFLYFIQATSMFFYDETKPNAAAIINGLKSIDMGLGQYISEMSKIISDIKLEYWEAIGFNRQRYGETYASDGKGNNEQALFRSSLVTADEDRAFERFIESEYDGLIDHSKVAYLDGKKAMFLTSNRQRAFLNVVGTRHLNTEYGFFFKNSQNERDKFQKLEALLPQFAQKGSVTMSAAIDAIEADSFSSLKSLMLKAEAAEKEYQKGIEDAKNQSAEKIQQMINTKEDKKNDTAIEIANINKDAAIETSIIKSEASVLGYDQGLNGEQDLEMIEYLALERQKLSLDERMKAAKQRLEERKQAHNEKVAKDKYEVDKEKLAIARRKGVKS